MRPRAKSRRKPAEATLFDPDTLAPAPDLDTELASLSGPSLSKLKPTTLAELKQIHGLTVLRIDAIEDRREQVNFADIFFTRRQSGYSGTVLRKGTGRGKSIDGLIAASADLSQDGRVLIITSRNMLVQQFAEYARSVFDLDANAIVEHSNAKIPISNRAALHKDPNARLVVATGETIRNDLKTAHLDPRDYSLLIIDEALHNTVGDYAYVPVLAAFKAAGVPFLALDATPANTRAQLESLGRSYGLNPATDFFNVSGDTDYHPEVITVPASPQVTSADWKITSQIARAAAAMARPSTLDIYADRVAGMTLFYAIRDALIESLTAAVAQIPLREFVCPDLTKTAVRFETCCRNALAGVFHGHAPTGLLNKITGQLDQSRLEAFIVDDQQSEYAKIDHPNARNIVGQAATEFANSMRLRLLQVEAALNPSTDDFGDLVGDSTQARIGPMRGLCVEINKCLSLPGLKLSHEGKFVRRFACEILTSFGAITFLTQYSEKHHDYTSRLTAQKQVRLFEAAIYGPDSDLLKTARQLAENSEFTDLLRSRAPVNKTGLKFPELLSQAQLQELHRGKLVTPKEWQMYDLIKQELRENPNARILVFADQVSAAAQLADAITLWSNSESAHSIIEAPINAHYICGTSGMTERTREQRKQQFKSGELQVLIITSVAIEGAHFEGADTLISISHLSNPGKLTQLMGRAGHGKNDARIYQLVAASSPDAARLQRAATRLHAAQDSLELMRQVGR